MHLTIGSILSAESLTEAQALLEQLRWQDGARTAGPVAREVKRNRQADLSSVAGKKLRTLLETTLQTHPVFTAAARPRRFSRLLVSETSDGGEYGAHVDNPFMGRGEDRMRTDVSFTLFLSDPESYEGGELVIEGETGHLVPVGDPAALAAAVLPLLDDPARRRAFGEAARQSVRERFDWPRTVAGYLAVYDEVLGRDTR